MDKEVKDLPYEKVKDNFYLTILDLIEKGHNPKHISERLKLSKQALNYHLSTLKAKGLIIKKGYGVWERSKNITLEGSKNSTKVGISLRPDFVRGHAFVIKFILPKDLKNWDKRESILSDLGIDFKQLNILGKGQQIIYKGHKVWLTNRSIIIYGKPGSSYFADNATNAKSMALNYFLSLARSLESHLKANFGQLRFKVSRHHYALVKNSLAKQYNEKGEKLDIRDTKGVWAWIDNSYNQDEFETGNRSKLNDSSEDHNLIVQKAFNDIKSGITPQFLMENLNRAIQQNVINSQNLDYYAKHLQSHVESVRKLGNAVEELTKIIKEKR